MYSESVGHSASNPKTVLTIFDLVSRPIRLESASLKRKKKLFFCLPFTCSFDLSWPFCGALWARADDRDDTSILTGITSFTHEDSDYDEITINGNYLLEPFSVKRSLFAMRFWQLIFYSCHFRLP